MDMNMIEALGTTIVPQQPKVYKAAPLVPITPKAQLQKDLLKDTPTNDYAMPEYIYRCDMLPTSRAELDQYPLTEQGEMLEIALVELDYTEGFPSLGGVEPIWNKFQWEPPEAFKAFKAYLDLPRESVLYADKVRDKPLELVSPVRQLYMLSALLALPAEEILSMTHSYYWTLRAQAYDAFTIATHAKMKEHRLLAAERDHYEMSRDFIEQGTKVLKVYLDHALVTPHEDDTRKQMSAKEALDVVKFFIQMQRLSLGANPFSANLINNNPGSLPVGASLEVIMRTLTQQSGAQINSKGTETEDNTASLFANPDALKQAQEVIIRLQDGNNPRKARAVTMQDLKEQNPFG